MKLLSHEEYVQQKESNAQNQSISSHIQKVTSKIEILKTEIQQVFKL